MLHKKAQLSRSPLEAPSVRSSASHLSTLETKKNKVEGSLDVSAETLNQHISQQLFVGDIEPDRKISNLRRLRFEMWTSVALKRYRIPTPT